MCKAICEQERVTTGWSFSPTSTAICDYATKRSMNAQNTLWEGWICDLDYLLRGMGPLSLTGGACLTNRGSVHIYLVLIIRSPWGSMLCDWCSPSPHCRGVGNYVTFFQAKGRMWPSKNSDGDLLKHLLRLSSVPSRLVDVEGLGDYQVPPPRCSRSGEGEKALFVHTVCHYTGTSALLRSHLNHLPSHLAHTLERIVVRDNSRDPYGDDCLYLDWGGHVD